MAAISRPAMEPRTSALRVHRVGSHSGGVCLSCVFVPKQSESRGDGARPSRSWLRPHFLSDCGLGQSGGKQIRWIQTSHSHF